MQMYIQKKQERIAVKMKFLFWGLVILSIPVGLFMSFFCWLCQGLGLNGTVIGDVMCIAGIPAALLCIVCAVLGILRLRKGDVKKAISCTLVALGYCAAIVAGFFIDEVVDTMLLEKSIADRNEQMYGENWDAAPAIEGIPEQYQEVLNKYYAVVRDRWSGDQLMDLGAVSMTEYYGDDSLNSIGFVLLDLNGDYVDELLIGAVAQTEQQGNEIFCIYTDPENPSYAINSVEGDVYYLRGGEADGTYEVEIAGEDRAWVIDTAQSENTFDFNLREGVMDPAGRMTLELIPFSQYK